MQFFFFILFVTIVSIPFISITNALLFSIGMLLFLVFGQMAIGFIVLLVESIFHSSMQSIHKDLKFGIWLTRIVTFVIILAVTYSYNKLLVISAVIGILYWLYAEYVGEKKYKLRLS